MALALTIRRAASRLRRRPPAFRLSTANCFSESPAAAAVTAESGLYGFPLLKTAKGFRRFVDEAIERSGELVSYISKLPPSEEIIRAMDEISNKVCCVIDSAELCRNTHPDRDYVEEASQAFMRIQEYLHEKVGASSETSPFISFVLGGPGSGKGTQCTKIAETFGFVHLSAGDLLRKEISSDGEMGAIICDIIKEGKIVPSEITVNLIRRAIESSENNKFLIDGFPRCNENRIAFERIVGMQPDFVLFFDCPEEDMVKRVLTRNQGRIDDNIETVKKRLTTFDELNLPVIKYYSGKGIVHKVNAVGTVEEVFDRVRPVFAAFKVGPD